MTMVSLPNILFPGGVDEISFFFNENASTFFEGDIFTADGSKPEETFPFVKTVEYSGDYPPITPKTGSIQSPSDVALILPSFRIIKTGAGTTTVTVLASDTVDTDDGVTLLDVGDLVGTTTFNTTRTLILPANKFLTIKTVTVSGVGVIEIADVRTIERGTLTRDIDPLLQ